ncbi:DDE-type integrase/transposase/recombinase [Kitasatospora sp. NPDC086801]|uniref:DDE-type integrase/transposase/recombinase n=1 Tax=Kitasatospora sp. NPDC086801 TaxID=3364066 RepID=UPI00382AE199
MIRFRFVEDHHGAWGVKRIRRVLGIARSSFCDWRAGEAARRARKPVFVPDLIGRDFTAPRPGTGLVGDMTFLPAEEGWLYLATCIDLATREVVGYAMADHHRAELPMAALRMAAGRGGLERGCIFHSDRGSEYASNEFRSEIGKLDMRQSMGRVDSCYDNAAAEHLPVPVRRRRQPAHPTRPRRHRPLPVRRRRTTHRVSRRRRGHRQALLPPARRNQHRPLQHRRPHL